MIFIEFKEMILTSLRQNFDVDGNIAPVFIFITPNNDFKVVPIFEIQNIGKEKISNLLKMICYKEKPKFSVYISEANLVRMRDEEANRFISNNFNSGIINASNHPNREDVIFLSFCSWDGVRNNVVYKVVDNVITKPNIELIEDFDSKDIGGLFSNLI